MTPKIRRKGRGRPSKNQKPNDGTENTTQPRGRPKSQSVPMMVDKEGDSKKYHFTRPMMTEDNFDFSFSGIKTAVTRKVEKMNQEEEEFKTEDLVASFQEAVVETLVEKTISAAKKHNLNQISVVGGVSANSRLRDLFRERLGKSGIKVYFPSLSLTTDNAAMIACLGFYKYQNHELGKLDLEVYSNQGI